MPKPTETILFVPGMGAREPGQYLNKLVSGIEAYCADHGHTLELVADGDPEHETWRRIVVTTAGGRLRKYELREVFWTDLRRNLTEERTIHKALLGFSLFWFWVSSIKFLQKSLHSKYMMLGTVFSACILLAWYYGVVMVALVAFGSSPEVPGIPANWIHTLKNIGESIGSWKPWLIASALMTMLPVTNIVNISYSTKRYLQNTDRFQQRATARLKREIIAAARKPGQRTLLAHSFGVVVATQALAALPAEYVKDLRIMSLGGPLTLIQERSEDVAQSVKQLTQWLPEKVLRQWTDFFSNADWLCTAAPVKEGTPGFVSRPLPSTVAWIDRISGSSHSLYFSDHEVIEEILGI